MVIKFSLELIVMNTAKLHKLFYIIVTEISEALNATL